MTSFNLILPELNSYISALGGANQKGLIITMFTISAAISRPFSGKLSDYVGRKKVMVWGILVCIVVSLLYPLCSTVLLFLFLRFFHGFSAGFYPTGATAMLTDILPTELRARGMGIFGTFSSLGIGVGQTLGSMIAAETGINFLFFLSAFLSFVAIALIFYIQETLDDPQKFKLEHIKIAPTDIIEKSVINPALIMLLTAPASGIIFVLVPEVSGFLGIENKGWFFGFYVLSTIFVRLFTSGVSDRIGRRPTMLIGIGFLILSLLLIPIMNTITGFTIAAIIYGIASGILSPTMFAYTADLSPHHRRGVGAGTLYIALELGIMAGSTSTLITYNNHPSSIYICFLIGVFLAALAGVYQIWHIIFRESET